MSGRTVDMHRLQELVRLKRLGCSNRHAAKLLAMGPNTHRDYVEVFAREGLLGGSLEELPPLEQLREAVAKHKKHKTPRQERSKVEPWADSIKEMHDRGAGPTAIFARLRLEESDFTASLGSVKRFCLRLKQERGVCADSVAIPVQTAPGDVAQVDFGYVGKLYDPERGLERKAYVFVLVLGFSRQMFAKVVFDQKTSTWLELHVQAFRALGGCPHTLVPDNLKAAVTRAAFDVQHSLELNRSYRELAQYYGFRIDPTPPYAPKKKGKVESAVKYAKSNFFKPRTFTDIDQANTQLAQWLAEVANVRVHGATGERPIERFELREREHLLELPSRPFEQVIWKQARLHKDSHVHFDGRLYSAPFQYIGKTLWVRATSRAVELYLDDAKLHTHDPRSTTGRYVTHPPHLPRPRWEVAQRSHSFWLERADAIGDEVGRYIRQVFESDTVAYQLRTVQSMVRHLESFPPHRAKAACVRAEYYGNYSYGALKGILAKGLDLQPVSEDLFPADRRGQAHYQFARTLTELFHPMREEYHESN